MQSHRSSPSLDLARPPYPSQKGHDGYSTFSAQICHREICLERTLAAFNIAELGKKLHQEAIHSRFFWGLLNSCQRMQVAGVTEGNGGLGGWEGFTTVSVEEVFSKLAYSKSMLGSDQKRHSRHGGFLSQEESLGINRVFELEGFCGYCIFPHVIISWNKGWKTWRILTTKGPPSSHLLRCVLSLKDL